MFKRIVTFAAFFICFYTITVGNIIEPRAYISEIRFDENGDWIIELGFMEYLQEEFDSIFIQTSAGTAKVLSLELLDGWGPTSLYDSIALITNANLDNSLTMDESGDFVRTYAYSMWSAVGIEYISFGDYTGSFLDSPVNGKSIQYVYYSQSAGSTGSFSMSNIHTIGLPNDTTGSLCWFSGDIYNPYGQPMSGGWFPFELMNTIVHINTDGSSLVRIFSRSYFVDTIMIRTGEWPYVKTQYVIDPTVYKTYPDSSVYYEIHTDSIAVNINAEKDFFKKINFIQAPNPFKKGTKFYFNIPPTLYYNNGEITISDLQGKLIETLTINNAPDGHINWFPKNDVQAGTYVAVLYLDNLRVKNLKLVYLGK